MQSTMQPGNAPARLEARAQAAPVCSQHVVRHKAHRLRLRRARRGVRVRVQILVTALRRSAASLS